MEVSHVPEHQKVEISRSPARGSGVGGGGAAIRAQGDRLQQTVSGQRGGIRDGRDRDSGHNAEAIRRSGHSLTGLLLAGTWSHDKFYIFGWSFPYNQIWLMGQD